MGSLFLETMILIMIGAFFLYLAGARGHSLHAWGGGVTHDKTYAKKFKATSV
jgi:hypothetical protein